MIEDYVLKMKTLANSLMAAGQQIPDVELVLYILSGLGPEFDFVVVNLTSKDYVTLLEVQYMLQTNERRLESLNAATVIDRLTLLHTLCINNPFIHQIVEVIRMLFMDSILEAT